MVRVLVALLVSAVGVAAQTPKAEEKPADKANEPWEARLTEGKVEKMTVPAQTLPLDTPFGRLAIPSGDVARIEFGVRYSDADRKRLTDAIADVLAADAKTRERGKDTLLEMGLKAYPLVARAAKGTRGSPHLTQTLDKLKAMLPDPDDEYRDHDLVFTADGSKLAGTLVLDAVEVAVGAEKRPLRAGEVRVLVNGGSAAAEEKIEVVAIGQFGVHGLLQTHFEKVVGVQVTAQVGGSVWGSGPYTTDSSLAAAAIHAGVLKPGETAVIKIRVKADPGGYVGSTKNGVTSSNYGPWQGCYEILGKVKKK
jgi:hypothetical protein